MTALYTDFKLEQGYSPNEIIAKARSLKRVQEPFSTKGYLDLFGRAGFVDVMSVIKWVCFEGFLRSSSKRGTVLEIAGLFGCTHGKIKHCPDCRCPRRRHFRRQRCASDDAVFAPEIEAGERRTQDERGVASFTITLRQLNGNPATASGNRLNRGHHRGTRRI